MSNILKQTIVDVLEEYTIDDGTTYQFNKLANEITEAVSKKIISHEIDYYSVVTEGKKDD